MENINSILHRFLPFTISPINLPFWRARYDTSSNNPFLALYTGMIASLIWLAGAAVIGLLVVFIF